MGLLGHAILLAVRLQVKKDTALEQLQKAQEHVTKVEEELQEAQADLARAVSPKTAPAEFWVRSIECCARCPVAGGARHPLCISTETNVAPKTRAGT